MAADDLSAPLRREGAVRTKAGRTKWPTGALTLSLAGVVGVAVWLIAWPLLRHEPLAGEPIVTISFNKTSPGTADRLSYDVPAMRESLSANDGEADLAPTGDSVASITIHRGIAPDHYSPHDNDTGPVWRNAPAGEVGQTLSRQLAKAPDSGLVERSPDGGLLPRIGKDGRRPAQVYARPADAPMATGGKAIKRIAILVTGLGIGAESTDEAIRRLAGPVSFAFAPYGNDLQSWVERARNRGHEVALQLPMEPFDYPDSDPGPHTMLANASTADNLEQLHWLLARMTGYFAITNYMGAKFTASPRALSPILDEAARRGLAFIDDGSSPRSAVNSVASTLGLPVVTGDIIIDADQSGKNIEATLKKLEALARKHGQALGVATALPSTIDAIARWADGLSARGIVLVPVSALMSRPSPS